MFTIRKLTSSDELIVKEMLMHAAHETSIESIESNAELTRYYHQFDDEKRNDGDFGFVAISTENDKKQKPLGAAWVRLWNDDIGYGYGYLEQQQQKQDGRVKMRIPELAIATLPDYRGIGIGTALMNHLLKEASSSSSFDGISLSCRSDNEALRLYERLGFVKVPGTSTINRVGGESFTMLLLFNGWSVRDATKDDVAVILSFLQKKSEFDREMRSFDGSLEATEEKISETIFPDVGHPYAHAMLAERQGKPMGFAFYAFRYSSFAARPSLWLDDLYVDEDVRGEGVGCMLMHRLADIARGRKCSHLGWTASVNNDRGMAFYLRLGAEVVSQNDKQYTLRWVPRCLQK